jgi:nitroreductase
MDFQTLLLHRYSVREYLPKPIEEEKIQQLLEAARYAPTAANRQPFRLIFVDTVDKKRELLNIYDRDWFVDAPIVICACGLPDQGWVRGDGKSYLDVDVAIVMDHVSLAAADIGLGTCWVASINTSAVRDLLRIPPVAEPIILMSLGYPADQKGDKERKPLSEIISYNHW